MMFTHNIYLVTILHPIGTIFIITNLVSEVFSTSIYWYSKIIKLKIQENTILGGTYQSDH